MIPKLIIQTSKDKQPQYLQDRILELSPGWNYQHFTDEDMLFFFQTNYLSEFHEIDDKVKHLTYGAHKADLFRYFYLYINGGVFLDSDLMITKSLDDIIGEHEFVAVNTNHSVTGEPLIFQGLLGVEPGNKIIYECLQKAFNTVWDDLHADYYIICRQMRQVLDSYSTKDYHLYKEVLGPENSNIFENDEIIAKHYFHTKIVPE